MIEWILSSSILIAAIILLRLIFKKHISAGMRYALWGLVLVRLLIPGNFVPSNFSIQKLTLAVERQPQVQQITQELNTPKQSYETVYQEVVKEHFEVYYPETTSAPDTLPGTLAAALSAQEQAEIRQEAELRVEQSAPIYSLKQILLGIWILGMAIIGAFLLTINWDFYRRLKRTRQRVEADTPVPVYKSFMAETPCLFGIFRPVIYITEETVKDPKALSHILAHESNHYRHKDHIWAFLRCVCLVLHWYNPLVWLAVSLSKRDCELACDEATITRIGEENRIEYGRTLVDMTCIKRAPSAILLTATTMLSDKKTLTSRIQQVARKPKVVIGAVVTAVIIAAAAVGCTFTGAPSETPDPTNPVETTDPVETTESTPSSTETASPEETDPSHADEPTPYEISLSNFREFFDSSTPDGRIRQMALTSFYSNASFVDLSKMFYSDLSKGQLTDAEKNFLTGKGFELNMDVQSHSTAEISSALQLAFGRTLDETFQIGLEQLTYFEDTDSYYSNHNSTNFPDITITRFAILESGNVALYYIPANMYVAGYENQEFIVTISQNRDGSIRILSNSLPGSNHENDMPRFPYAPSNTAVKALPENVQLADLVNPYWELGAQFVPNGSTYYVFIPEIYPFSQEAIDCQAQIYELFADELKSQLNYLISNYHFVAKYLYTADVTPEVGKAGSGAFYYGYTASYQNGVLSIVVIIDDIHSGRETYHTFNLNVPSGTSSTGAQPSREAIRAALEAEYKQMHTNIDSSLDFYQENLKKTLSDENIDACVLSYAEDSTPQVTAWIYTIGSVDKVQKIISVSPLSE